MADPDLELRREGGTLFFVYHSPCLLFFLLQFSFFFNPEWGGLCAPGPSPRSTKCCILLNNSFLTGFFPFFFCSLHTHARWITSFLRIFLTLLTPLQIQGGLCRRVLGSRWKFCNQNLKHWKFTSSIYFLAYLSSSVKEKKLCVFF